MTIRTSCSACSAKVKVDDRFAGKTVRCPGCQQLMTIPSLASAEEIHDPFAADAEAMVTKSSPPPPVSSRPARRHAPPDSSPVAPTSERLRTKPSRAPRPSPVAGQPETQPEKSVPSTDFEPPPPEQDPSEFPDLSDEDLHGEVISPPKRRKKPVESQPVVTAAKVSRPTQRAVTSSVASPGWRWHLHWCLAVALLPLILMPFLAYPTSVEERLKQTIENHPELNLEGFDPIESLHEFVRLLPDHRIEGSLLSAETYWHWGMAIFSGMLFTGLLLLMWPDGERRLQSLITVGIATGTLGILILLGFQWLAFHTQGLMIRGHGVFSVFFLVIKLIGFSYRCANDAEGGFLVNFAGYTFGVGLCEELCKSLPVIFYVRSDQRTQTLRTACLVGLASGVGFGVSEGIMYSVDYYNGVEDVWVYLVRFLSCVSLHAIWAGGVAILMFINQDHLEFSWADAASYVAFYLSPAMILHGLYNTLLTHQYEHAASICAILSFIWLQWLLLRHSPQP